jgi:hypothetical protein
MPKRGGQTLYQFGTQLGSMSPEQVKLLRESVKEKSQTKANGGGYITNSTSEKIAKCLMKILVEKASEYHGTTNKPNPTDVGGSQDYTEQIMYDLAQVFWALRKLYEDLVYHNFNKTTNNNNKFKITCGTPKLTYHVDKNTAINLFDILMKSIVKFDPIKTGEVFKDRTKVVKRLGAQIQSKIYSNKKAPEKIIVNKAQEKLESMLIPPPPTSPTAPPHQPNGIPTNQPNGIPTNPPNAANDAANDVSPPKATEIVNNIIKQIREYAKNPTDDPETRKNKIIDEINTLNKECSQENIKSAKTEKANCALISSANVELDKLINSSENELNLIRNLQEIQKKVNELNFQKGGKIRSRKSTSGKKTNTVGSSKKASNKK